jgi:hypothetical protein
LVLLGRDSNLLVRLAEAVEGTTDRCKLPACPRLALESAQSVLVGVDTSGVTCWQHRLKGAPARGQSHNGTAVTHNQQ